MAWPSPTFYGLCWWAIKHWVFHSFLKWRGIFCQWQSRYVSTTFNFTSLLSCQIAIILSGGQKWRSHVSIWSLQSSTKQSNERLENGLVQATWSAFSSLHYSYKRFTNGKEVFLVDKSLAGASHLTYMQYLQVGPGYLNVRFPNVWSPTVCNWLLPSGPRLFYWSCNWQPRGHRLLTGSAFLIIDLP